MESEILPNMEQVFKQLSRMSASEFSNESYWPCLEDINATTTAFNAGELWAMKYFDSMELRPTGLLNSRTLWLGEFDECLAIEPHFQIAPKYCLLGLGNPNSTNAPDSVDRGFVAPVWSACVSKRCSVQDLAAIFNPILISMNSKRGVFVPILSSCFDTELPYEPIEIFTYCIFAICGLILLASLVLDLKMRWKADQYDNKPQNTIIKALLCFSPFTNFKELFSLDSKTSSKLPDLTCVNAFRTLSLAWIVLLHSYGSFGDSTSDNALDRFNLFPKYFNYMAIRSGAFAVDTFLVLSALFAYYSMARDFKATETPLWKKLPLLYLHRYIRLTVPYVGLMLLAVGLWPHLSAGPEYYQITDLHCAHNWWANLLYVNNFVATDELCLKWTWYLAVDMQFYVVLAPFLTWMFFKKPLYGWIASAVALVGQITSCFLINYLLEPSKVPKSMYLWSVTRMGPYIVGCVLGWVVFDFKINEKHLLFRNTKLFASLWALSLSILLVLIYGMFGVQSEAYENPPVADALYYSFARTAWGLAVSWILLACFVRKASFLGDFLWWQAWVVPARLSYCGYLLHPLVLLFFAQTSRRTYHFTDITNIYLFCGVFMLTIGVSAIFSMVFDVPIGKLQKIVQNRQKPT